MEARDELEFVIGSREACDWGVSLIRQHRLDSRPFGLLFSTVFSKLSPTQLAEEIVDDRLPVRFQLQQHQYLWEPNARGV